MKIFHASALRSVKRLYYKEGLLNRRPLYKHKTLLQLFVLHARSVDNNHIQHTRWRQNTSKTKLACGTNKQQIIVGARHDSTICRPLNRGGTIYVLTEAKKGNLKSFLSLSWGKSTLISTTVTDVLLFWSVHLCTDVTIFVRYTVHISSFIKEIFF